MGFKLPTVSYGSDIPLCCYSKDILSRWTFPLVPDDNHPGGHIYEHTRGNRYIAKDNSVILARYVSRISRKYDFSIYSLCLIRIEKQTIHFLFSQDM